MEVAKLDEKEDSWTVGGLRKRMGAAAAASSQFISIESCIIIL